MFTTPAGWLRLQLAPRLDFEKDSACLTDLALQRTFAVRIVWVLALLGFCSCGRTVTYTRAPGCVRLPEATPLLTVETINESRRLWNTDGCIPVTYAPALESHLPTIQAALDAWGKVACSGLCFGVPISRAEGPLTDVDLRLHIADAGPGVPGAWELLSDGNNGRALHATIYVNTSSTVGEILRQLGLILGFAGGFARDTVLDETRVPNPRTGLGMLDSQSVCAVYPPCR